MRERTVNRKNRYKGLSVNGGKVGDSSINLKPLLSWRIRNLFKH